MTSRKHRSWRLRRSRAERMSSSWCEAPISAPGAYILWLDLDAAVDVPVQRLTNPVLPAGRYAYCGSARGPGGLRARLDRHARPGRRPHWHIDHLLDRSRLLATLVVPDGDECALTAFLEIDRRAFVPAPGFGSSDCRTCESHLIGFRQDADPAELVLRWQGAKLLLVDGPRRLSDLASRSHDLAVADRILAR